MIKKVPRANMQFVPKQTEKQFVDFVKQVPRANMQFVPKQTEKIVDFVKQVPRANMQFVPSNGPLVVRRKTIIEFVEKIVGVPQGYYEEQFVDFPEVVMVEPFMRGVARWLEAHAPPVDVPG